MFAFYSYVLDGCHNFGLVREMILSVEKMELEKPRNLGKLFILHKFITL